MAVPNTFATRTTPIPLSLLDADFAYYDAAFSISGINITFAGAITVTGGTANGVAYLNGSKVLTSGSALTFDGTNLGVTAGNINLGNAFFLNGRNTANTGFVPIVKVAAGDILEFGSGGYNANFTGNLGIGTSSPATKLTVEGSLAATTSLDALKLLTLRNNSDGGVGINFTNAVSVPLASLDALVTSAGGGTDDGILAFSTATDAVNTERMRIDSSGNLLVGDKSQILSGNLGVLAKASSNAAAFKSNASTSFPILNMWGNESSGNQIFSRFATDFNIERGSITYNRGAGLIAYNVTSDYRAKDIIGPVSDSGALIDSVPVYMGKMKDATQERPMFIAHETPIYAHTGEKDAVDANGNPMYQQMDASALVPVMWAEIQSLRKRLATLESK